MMKVANWLLALLLFVAGGASAALADEGVWSAASARF